MVMVWYIYRSMKVFRAMTYGIDTIGYIVLADNFEECCDIIRREGSSLDHDDIHEIPELIVSDKIKNLRNGGFILERF